MKPTNSLSLFLSEEYLNTNFLKFKSVLGGQRQGLFYLWRLIICLALALTAVLVIPQIKEAWAATTYYVDSSVTDTYAAKTGK